MQFPLQSVFLALPLENEAKWQFQALQEELKPFENILRFQNPQSPHLTLQFWSEVMEIEYNQILLQAEKIASRHTSFSVEVTGVNTFGNRSEDHVLFLDVHFSDPLARVKKDWPWPSGKPFSPHITLARISHPQRFAVEKKKIMKLVGDANFPITFDRLRLYAEVDGRKQTLLQDFLFKT